MNSQNEDMKVYRPGGSKIKISSVASVILFLAVIGLGVQNYSLRGQLLSKVQDEAPTEEKKVEDETLQDTVLTQGNPTEDWRIYRNLTYNYKFRTPKVYTAKVNNPRNSVEVFNEGNQKVMEIYAEPKSDTNQGTESEKKVEVGSTLYNVFEYPDGGNQSKSPYSTYKTASEKHTFSLHFYNTVDLDEVKKLILATFSEIE